MKLSLKFRDDTHQNPLLRAKIPVTILGLPFLSGIVAGDSSDLSFSIKTNFSSGPSVSLAYHPTLSTSRAATTSTTNDGVAANFTTCPFSLSLKSGIGLFGSPQNSPLICSAHFNLFSLNSSNPTLTPAFSLLIKPQFGGFSLRKSTSSSNPSSIQLNGVQPNGEISNGFIQDSELPNGFVSDKPLEWRESKKVESYSDENAIFSGIFVTAKTSMPLTKRSLVNFQWGVDFAREHNGRGSKLSLPVLMLNKIWLERAEEVKRVEERKNEETAAGDLELLKRMCGWMKGEVEDLQKGNRDLRQALDEMKSQGSNLRTCGEEKDSVSKRGVSMPSGESLGESARWRSRKSGLQAEEKREAQKSVNWATEVENELQKAIKDTIS
ncbi:hypothetical protein Ancab_015704 [Ancistrocladus abbreviatus]